MECAFFSAKLHDREFFDAANRRHGHRLTYFEPRLSTQTAPLAAGSDAVCLFVNDAASGPVLNQLHEGGVRLLCLRCAGFNQVDLRTASALGMPVVRVPAYSPHAVAEHTAALILTLNRKIHRAHARVREGNFALDGLLGFDLHGKTAGVVGTGQIGEQTARILHGFGCRLLGFDPTPNEACEALGLTYVDLPRLLGESDIVTLHCPLTPDTHHLIDAAAIREMKPGVMLINTSRGALVDTPAVVDGLKSGRVGYLGLDVYEEEADLFFEDLSNQVIQDDVFSRLLTFPNVVITGHQAFFTRNALESIAETTLANMSEYERGQPLTNEVAPDRVVPPRT